MFSAQEDEAFGIVLVGEGGKWIGGSGVGFGREDIGHAPMGLQAFESLRGLGLLVWMVRIWHVFSC